MASIYLNQRQSMPLFICFIYLICSQIILLCHCLHANNSFYIADIRVDVKDSSAAQARLKAIAQGQYKAFDALIKRLLSLEDQASLIQPSENQLNTMIKNFEVLSEKNSAVRYIGVLAFQFHQKKVEEFLKQKGKTILSTNINEKILVLPIFKFEESKKILVWQENNPWRHAWNHRLESTSPYSLPLGDLEDVLNLPEQMALKKDFDRLQLLRQRYHNGYVLIAILKQGSPFELDLFLYDDKGLRFSEENISLLGETTLTSKLMNSAIHKVIDITNDALNEDKMKPEAGRDFFELQISFHDHQEWLKIQKIMSSIALIRSFDVVSLQKRQAVVQLQSPASHRRIFQALEKEGFDITIIDSGAGSEKFQLRLNSIEQQRLQKNRSSMSSPKENDNVSFYDEINERRENFYEALEKSS